MRRYLKWGVGLVLLLCVPVQAQTSGFGLFSGGNKAKSILNKGTSLPATCIVGDLYQKTDAPSGQQLYACTSVNTWTPIGSGGAAGAGGNPTEVNFNQGGSLAGDPGFVYISAGNYIALDSDVTPTNGSGVRLGAGNFSSTQVPNMIQAADDLPIVISTFDAICGGTTSPYTLRIDPCSYGANFTGSWGADGGFGTTSTSASAFACSGVGCGITVKGDVTLNSAAATVLHGLGAGTHDFTVGSGTVAEAEKATTWAATQTFSLDIVNAANKGAMSNFTNPFTGVNRILWDASNTFNGTIDHVARICHNCNANGTKAVAAWPFETLDFEASYDDTNDGTVNYWNEINWNTQTASGHPLGGSVAFRPLALATNMFHNPPDAIFGWVSRYGQDLNADGTLDSPYGDYSMYIGVTGAAIFGGASVVSGQLNVDGSGILGLGGSTGGQIVAEGVTVNSIRTTLKFDEPTVGSGDIYFPNTKGVTMEVVAVTNLGTSWAVLAGDGSAPMDTGDEVCQKSGLVCDKSATLAGTLDGTPCTTTHTGNTFYAFCRKA